MKKQMNPMVKLLLEFGPIILFFMAYRWASVPEGATEEERQLVQLLFATKVFIPTILVTLAISWFWTKSLPKMALITAIIVIVMGGLTLWLQDGTFIKMKPTILYGLFAVILGFGLMRGQSYLQYAMDDAMPLEHEGWMKFTKRFALFFVGMALANEVVWRFLGTDIWVNFKTFGLPAVMLIFMISQAPLLTKYAIEETKD